MACVSAASVADGAVALTLCTVGKQIPGYPAAEAGGPLLPMWPGGRQRATVQDLARGPRHHREGQEQTWRSSRGESPHWTTTGRRPGRQRRRGAAAGRGPYAATSTCGGRGYIEVQQEELQR